MKKNLVTIVCFFLMVAVNTADCSEKNKISSKQSWSETSAAMVVTAAVLTISAAGLGG